MARWLIKIEGWGPIIQNDDLTWEEKRDKLAILLRSSQWFKVTGEDSDLDMAIMDLEDSPSDDDAEQALWTIYNLADEDRVWLDPSLTA